MEYVHIVTADEVYPVVDVVVRNGICHEIDVPILEQHRLGAAVHIANSYIRTHDEHVHDRLVDVIQSSRVPLAFIDALIHRLGKNRALAAGLNERAVAAALPHVL